MKVKKVLTYLGIAFVIFFLYTRPAEAAEAVRGVFDGVADGANSLATFVSQVFAR
ncbi:hypothetical protein GCM10010106_07150 [Thermopolyspora flexuosa]|jgi:hypothetical protein|uniref:Uncharacterized protein n=1 Tax=Thermopolyspora flexuosa TaxID=103836 RepID=A0A543IZJ9_9ACTN|nr:hypothetical protein [Thermopolyspora flexuosa]TQM75988.1 hypothetical protein FHX40_2712 [Thermopolyspora flexuosa]GGM63747.1 hypothetical protein GCM10010106_07150 [Thermopolyspora flexuosa]